MGSRHLHQTMGAGTIPKQEDYDILLVMALRQVQGVSEYPLVCHRSSSCASSDRREGSPKADTSASSSAKRMSNEQLKAMIGNLTLMSSKPALAEHVQSLLDEAAKSFGLEIDLKQRHWSSRDGRSGSTSPFTLHEPAAADEAVPTDEVEDDGAAHEEQASADGRRSATSAKKRRQRDRRRAAARSPVAVGGVAVDVAGREVPFGEPSLGVEQPRLIVAAVASVEQAAMAEPSRSSAEVVEAQHAAEVEAAVARSEADAAAAELELAARRAAAAARRAAAAAVKASAAARRAATAIGVSVAEVTASRAADFLPLPEHGGFSRAQLCDAAAMSPPMSPPMLTSEATASGEMCCVCLTGELTHTLVPCGHRCLCAGCAAKQAWEHCPLCAQEAQFVMQTYG
jgi:hypothetical protein